MNRDFAGASPVAVHPSLVYKLQRMPTLSDIAGILDLPIRGGDPQAPINGVAGLNDAGPEDISLLSSDAYIRQFNTTRAAAVIVARNVKLPTTLLNKTAAVLVAEDAELSMARVLEIFAPPVPRPAVGIHSAAHVAEDASIDPTAAIGPMVVVGKRFRIGARSIIHPGVMISDDVTIGQDCQVFQNVVLRERVTLGDRVIIHAGSVLGSDGFGYRWDGKKHAKIPQIGRIIVEDDVEIGSCVCVDRAKMGITKIGRGTKIDNLVQIAHNCIVGPHCILVGQVGLAGSVVLGSGVAIGGQTAIRDHVTMGDGSMAAACSGVAEDVDPKVIVSGVPALPHRQALREQAAMRRLPDLITQMRKIQEEIEQLKKAAAAR